MDELFRFIIPTVLFIIQVLLSLPEISESLNISGSNVQLGIGVFIILLFLLNQLQSVYFPFKRLEITRLNLLDQQCEVLIKEANRAGFELRINVMLAKHKFLFRKEPKYDEQGKRKLTLLGKRFDFFWVSPNMNFYEDRNLRLTTNQGVCGEAYRSGGIKMADLIVENPATYNLCKEQIEKTKELIFILSCPIRRLDYRTDRLRDKIIGVVNFDSRTEGVEEFINDDVFLNDLTEKIVGFSVLCSRIL